jgi:hypothetical protein
MFEGKAEVNEISVLSYICLLEHAAVVIYYNVLALRFGPFIFSHFCMKSMS